MSARGPSFRSHAACALFLTFLSFITFAHASTFHAKRLDHVIDNIETWKTPVWKNRFPMKRDSYVFNATSHKNLAVYFGQTAATRTTTLYNQCADDSVDIVMLAFLRQIWASGGYPYLDMGSTCSGTSTAQEEAGATELLDCADSLGVMITECQALGKKVLLSIGGSGDDVVFTSAENATESATLLWNLFGGGSNYTALRPFGNATIDGFDLDVENTADAYFTDFVSTLRSLYANQAAKSYYISATPSCSLTKSLPVSVLNLMDWVWVRFYNAAACQLGSSGFSASVGNWSTRLDGPNFYIGALGTNSTSTGYQDPDTFANTIDTVYDMGICNIGGVMFWDGSNANQTTDAEGKTFLTVAKAAMQSASTPTTCLQSKMTIIISLVTAFALAFVI